MATFNINGNSFNFPDGANVSIINGRIMVNGVEHTTYNQNTNVVVNIAGNVGNLDVAGSANVTGSVTGKCDAGGSIEIGGNVDGNVDAGGSVTCGDVIGDVDAGGSVKCGRIGGIVDAGGSIRHG